MLCAIQATLAFSQLPVGTFGFKDIMAVVLVIVQGSVSLLLVVKKIRQLVTRWRQIKVWILGTSVGGKVCCCFKVRAATLFAHLHSPPVRCNNADQNPEGEQGHARW